MSFDSVAREIVANSIRSAICIDDEFVEPYKEQEGKVKDIDKPKQLTETFRQSNCTLDIHTYTSYPEFKKEENFIFKNRDLLILDWELTDDPVKFKDTLEILRDAAENPGLAFVLIYTKEPDLAGIELQIRSFFNQKVKSKSERDEVYEQLFLRLDEKFFNKEQDSSFDEAESFFGDRKIKNALKELVAGAPSDEAVKNFEADIRKCFPGQNTGAEFLRIFEESAKELYRCSRIYECCEQIEFHNRRAYVSAKEYFSYLYCHKIHHQEHALWVNNTYIIILHKKTISPDSVYEQFSNHLCSKPGNIMSLIALEMKNNFRENSGKVGKGLLEVDELAFFHHRRDLLPDEEEFYDFLRNNWKHQVASFHLESHSKVFPVLKQYIKKNKINEKIEKILNGNKIEAFQNELAKLNFQYSFHHAKRKDKDYIRFGDIFSIRESAEAENSEGYLLSITAHCDCLRPEKIGSNFYFVSGKEDELKRALEKVDGENHHYSFLFRDNDPLCISISWKTKPFTIFLPDKKRMFSSKKYIKGKIEEKIKYLFFEGTLLENYTQRIANKSFADAARVGVDLAKLDMKKKKK